MGKTELETLTKDELIELILAQYEQLTKLQADYEALRLKFEKNQKPPTSSKNSSQPPSRDQKGSLPAGRRRHRHGPPLGHEKHVRKFVAQPDQTIELRAKSCGKCHSDLSNAANQLVDVNQITELPHAPAQVIEVRQYAVTCPQCGASQAEEPPPGLEMHRAFGTRLEATVVYYRQEQHMSYARTQKALLDLHQVEISQGGIDEIMKRAGKWAMGKVEQIQNAISQSKVIHCDETSNRIDGANAWEWVFCSLKGVLHVIRRNRSVEVIRDIMGENQAEVWVSDCYAGQLKAPARQRQLCMAHQLRALQHVLDVHPHLTWAHALQKLFQHAIQVHHQHNQMTREQFERQVAHIERNCDRLLEQDLAPPEAQKLQRRYLKYRSCLFVFLHRSDVEPTNNVAERALRHSVVHRKVTNGFRSHWGTRTYAALASVIDTAELNGIRAFDAIQALFGPSALPIPICGE
jgi:transposase